MKKYRLIKDIPKFKTGTEFRISSKGHLAHGDSMVYHKNDLEKHPEILTDWFQEIPEKPKTVWDLKDGDECWKIDGGWRKGYTNIFFNSYARDIRDLGDFLLVKKKRKKKSPAARQR